MENYPFLCCLPSSLGNEGNIFQIDEETGNITMAKAADIVGPIILTVLVRISNNFVVIFKGKLIVLILHDRYIFFWLTGITGDQQRSVCSDTGDH